MAENLILDPNGITLKWIGGAVASPTFVQANPRGTGSEWFAVVNNTAKSFINSYAKNQPAGINYFTSPGGLVPFNNIVTTLMTSMSSTFSNCTTFNQLINSWDLSNVVSIANMFGLASNFNQPIGIWNTSNVVNMYYMFFGAYSFNQSINRWNTSKVVNMSAMFAGASVFNQSLECWNTSSVIDMSYMFYGAYSFNQNLTRWYVVNIPTEPVEFSTASPLQNSNKPIWGTNGNPCVSVASFTTAALVGSQTTINLKEKNINGDNLSYQITVQPVNGTLTQVSNGVYLYQPVNNVLDSFKYIATDGVSVSSPGTVSIQNYNQQDVDAISKQQATWKFENISFDGNQWKFGNFTTSTFIQYPNYNSMGNWKFSKP